jgi:large subunit ribosomal protein L18
MAKGSTKNLRKLARDKRQRRVRKKITGTQTRPRLCVFRSSKYTYAQLISDDEGKVIASTSSKVIGGKSLSGKGAAKKVGEKIAELAKEKQIESVVFDRNGYLYHGRVAAVCEGAREGGLQV